MKIIDGLKLQGTPAQIPDCSRDDLPQFFADMGFKVGVDIGVYKGEFSEKLCRAGMKVYAIDPWLAYPDYQGGRINYQQRQNDIYEHAKRLLAHYDCQIIKKMSMEAINDFEDGSLDFVSIDANHSFKYIAEDLCGWSKKLREGGVIFSACYLCVNPKHSPNCQAKYVIDAYTKAYGIDNWYIIGNKEELFSCFWVNKKII
jgi:hypothetical protein